MLYMTFIDWLTVLTAAAGACLAGRHYIHMLQLSSYQFQGYFRTLRSKPGQYGLHIGVFVMFLAQLLFTSAWMSIPSWIDVLSLLFLVFLIFQYHYRPAKKPLVITARVWRLIAVLTVLGIITFGISYRIAIIPPTVERLPGWYPPAYLTALKFAAEIWAAFIPLLTALGALIAKPVETAVSNWYIRDAKRILSEHPGLKIIGVTGSYGKTSMKYALNTILSEGFRVLMTPGSYNTPMGVVRTIREQLKPMHDIFICEMGARHVHDIKELCDIVNPDDGVLTAIGQQHLETFRSTENIVATKFELLDAVAAKNTSSNSPAQGRMFINIDNELIRNNNRYKDAITYGTDPDATYRATNITVSKNGTLFTVIAPGGEWQEIRMPLVGRHNVINVTGAIAVAHSYGITLRKIALAAGRLSSVPHRLELSRHGNITILDDSYNSNPDGVRAALEVLSLYHADSRSDTLKILVTPGMVELGSKEKELNFEFGKEAAEVCDRIILVGEQAAPIRDGALEAGFDEANISICHDLKEAGDLMYSLDPGRERIILLENDLPDNY